MENIINRIIEIDRKADKRLTDAEKESSKLIKNSEREAADLKEDLRTAAEIRISEVCKFHKTETEQAVSKINSDCEEKIRMLDEAYEKKHLSIEENIFHTIVGENID